MIAELLDASGSPAVEAIAVGVGPGPYTGLRVGIATAQGLALGWGVPAVGLCSLDAIAAEAVAAGVAGAFVAASDARRREVYWARYDGEGLRADGPYVMRVDDAGPAVLALPWVGEGAGLHRPASIPAQAASIRFPRAEILGRLANRLLAQGAAPTAIEPALSAHGGDDGATARSLGTHRLLTLAPLYVRRPDAAEPGVVA